MIKVKLLSVAAVSAAFFVGPGAGVALADFVCPVLPVSENAKGSPQWISIAGGDTSILPGKAGNTTDTVNVPDQATNQNGAGSPGGAHAVPGESGYTAIWNTN